jgi:hypothetical protein
LKILFLIFLVCRSSGAPEPKNLHWQVKQQKFYSNCIDLSQSSRREQDDNGVTAGCWRVDANCGIKRQNYDTKAKRGNKQPKKRKEGKLMFTYFCIFFILIKTRQEAP